MEKEYERIENECVFCVKTHPYLGTWLGEERKAKFGTHQNTRIITQ